LEGLLGWLQMQDCVGMGTLEVVVGLYEVVDLERVVVCVHG
jgi:hypothetical protein